jgi:hypothetical protein
MRQESAAQLPDKCLKVTIYDGDYFIKLFLAYFCKWILNFGYLEKREIDS